jgi:S-adenosylmethionine-dependent methyltransferase
MARGDAGGTARNEVIWVALTSVLAERAAQSGRSVLEIVDAGGGTGGFAVPLAELGHAVTVVDPSPDALAALERRSAEAGMSGRVAGLQGDVAALPGLIGAERADIVLCHGVLEVVDDPAGAVAALAKCLRPGGVVSVLVANKNAAVLARALAGRFAEARHVLEHEDGRFGSLDPLPRRFTFDAVSRLLTSTGLSVTEVHGVRVFADLVPAALIAAEPGAQQELRRLEIEASTHPALRDVAAQLHVLATRR